MENNKTNFSIKITKKNFLKLPAVPGVYKFLKNKKPIYIGKSINLKNRLNSYLTLDLGIKTTKMVNEAEEVEYIEVQSELESLLLESYLIKKHKPKYNIVLKDDKHALYIVITNEEFPRVITARKINLDTLKIKGYYGPFPSSKNVKMILKMLRKVFPFSDHKIGKKSCIYSHIGLCKPCPSLITNIQNPIIKQIQTKQYKQNIKNVNLVLSRKFNFVRNKLEKEMLMLSKQQNFEVAREIREKIKILDYITQKRISETEYLENPNLVGDIRSKEMNSLNLLLQSGGIQVEKLNRTECFDVAHLQGVAVSASMVVFISGEKDSGEYRHFKIKQKKGNSDYDSMREIARRRVKNINNWDKPDLIIVDCGLGQVKIFNQEFKKFKIPVVGIAKHPDRLVFPNGKKVRLLGDVLNIIARIRDEAHRFARRLHHKQLDKALLLFNT